MRVAASKFAYLALAGMTAASCSSSSSKGATNKPSDGRSFTLFATAELRGNIEPCGCTSDPMGDLSRTVAMIAEARSGSDAVIYVDAGSMLYSDVDIAPEQEAQEAAKSDLLVQTLTERLKVAAIGLGPNDLSKGPAAVRPPRQVVNLATDSKVPTEPPIVVEAGGVKVGIFGVVGASALGATEVEVTDPVAASVQAVKQLEGAGADVVVGLIYMTMQEARTLARAVEGVDIMVVGQQAPEPDKVEHEPARIGNTWLVQPGNRGQVVTRLDVTVRDGGEVLTDAIGEARAQGKIASIDERIPKLEAQIAEWKKDPNADPAFIATKEQELVDLRNEREALAKNPLRLPERGSWFVMDQVEIKKQLACDPKVQSLKVALDKAVGESNLKAAAGTVPPKPAEGQAGFAGSEECGYCHGAAVKFWQKTKHAEAWETLEKYGKQYSYDCIYCHVTGWKEPGGSNLAVNEHLRDVQCEVCHGPGSLHVDADGKGGGLVLAPPETRCLTCHNEEHSDTFDYEAYLRDVTGPGHGEAFRAKLGDGPTGHELRSAALKKAGSGIGQGCLK